MLYHLFNKKTYLFFNLSQLENNVPHTHVYARKKLDCPYASQRCLHFTKYLKKKKNRLMWQMVVVVLSHIQFSKKNYKQQKQTIYPILLSIYTHRLQYQTLPCSYEVLRTKKVLMTIFLTTENRS